MTIVNFNQSGNEIGDEGACALAQALQTNDALTTLRIGCKSNTKESQQTMKCNEVHSGDNEHEHQATTSVTKVSMH